MIQGLLSDLERKSIEPIAVLLRESTRPCADKIHLGSKMETRKHEESFQAELAAMLSEEGGMITGDDTVFPKKAATQWGGASVLWNTGKIDNCQYCTDDRICHREGNGLFDWDL
jgi:SRSO17 transposase